MKTWSLTLREVLRLRRIFGLKKDEVRKVWRRLHNEELYHNTFNHRASLPVYKLFSQFKVTRVLCFVPPSALHYIAGKLVCPD